MSEIAGFDPTLETARIHAQKAVQISAESAFNPNLPKTPDQLEARRKLDQEARSLTDRLLGLAANVAQALRESGFRGKATAGIESGIKQQLWASAQERARSHLLERAAKAPTMIELAEVWQTLKEIDPPVEIQARHPDGTIRRFSANQSMGLKQGETVTILGGNLVPNLSEPEIIFLDGKRFSLDTIGKTLAGERNLKPMYVANGVWLPLIDPKTGEKHPQRRAAKTGYRDPGDPSEFQLRNAPINLAQRLKQVGLADSRLATAYVDSDARSNQIFGSIGDKETNEQNINSLTYQKEEIDAKFLLIASDGARPAGMLLDPNTPYSQEVNLIMTQLEAGKINLQEASQKICQAARKIPGEDDDITVQIIDLRNWVTAK